MQTRLGLAALVVLLTTACSSSEGGRTTTPSYDPETGRLVTLTTDTNGNGVPDTTSYMDGARIVRIELDLDENGQVERWDFYTPDGTLEKVGLSHGNDGVMDAQAFYGPAAELVRMEISTGRNGVFDRVEHYQAGRLTRSADDTNGDGTADKWDAYVEMPGSPGAAPAYSVASTAVDESGSGRPERRFVFGPGGSIARIEVDPDGDGIFIEHTSRR